MGTMVQPESDAGREFDSGRKLTHKDTLLGTALKGKKETVQAMVAKKAKRATGRPSEYSEAKADMICREIEKGRTLTSIIKEMNVSIDCVYGWLSAYDTFSERYKISRERMARSLTDELIDDTKAAKPEEALLLKVKGNILQWAISRFNPREFGDTKRLELSGQIDHRHTHELTVEQKQRIAESWLMSQQANGVKLITAETSGPDLPVIEGVAVREICETEQGVRPQRKRTTPEMASKAKGKPGRKPKAKPKVDLERLSD